MLLGGDGRDGGRALSGKNVLRGRQIKLVKSFQRATTSYITKYPLPSNAEHRFFFFFWLFSLFQSVVLKVLMN